MSAPAPTRTQVGLVAAVEEQQAAVRHCLLLVGRAFDVPCACGHISDQCTKREDGTCDG